jgi:hypothetical protein
MRRIWLFTTVLLWPAFVQAQILEVNPRREVRLAEVVAVSTESGTFTRTISMGEPDSPQYAFAHQNSTLDWQPGFISISAALDTRATPDLQSRSTFSLEFEISSQLAYELNASSAHAGPLVGVTAFLGRQDEEHGLVQIFDFNFGDDLLVNASGSLDPGVYFATFDVLATSSELLPVQEARLDFTFTVVPEPQSYALVFGLACMAFLGYRKARGRA